MQTITANVFVDPALVSWTVDLASATRKPAERGLPQIAPYISYGASPRGPISVVAAARALGRAVGPNEEDGAAGVGGAELAERARGLVFEDSIPGVQAGKRAGMNGVLSVLVLRCTLFDLGCEQ